MSGSPGHDYDRVAYPSLVHLQTFAESLAIRGHLHGLDAAPPDRCRVLELGCGDGFNLAAMAAVHPSAAYLGIDYSADTIARGRRMLADMGLADVRLEAADIRALDALKLEPGSYDYIVAHGVYSWVPADVRDALLAAIGRLLAPQGVAFVSYLAAPGSYQREAVRSIIRYHTRALTDPREQVRQARAILRVIADGVKNETPYSRWIGSYLEEVERRPAEGVFHDELSAESTPLLFMEFMAHAGKHGLQFLSEAEYLVPVGPALTDEARTQLAPLQQSRLLREQYLDFLEGRRFRQTLLCRAGVGTELVAARVDSLWVGSHARPSAPESALATDDFVEFSSTNTSRVRVNEPADKAVLFALAAQPGSRPVPTVLTATKERLAAAGLPPAPQFEDGARHFLCRACMPGLVEFSWQRPAAAAQVPVRPLAHPLARWLLRQGADAVINYSGRSVDVRGPLGRHLLSLLDGTRDHAALTAELRTFLAVQHAAARARGESADLPAADDPTLPEQLRHSLSGLRSNELLRRD